jgi:hypothetical protein
MSDNIGDTRLGIHRRSEAVSSPSYPPDGFFSAEMLINAITILPLMRRSVGAVLDLLCARMGLRF